MDPITNVEPTSTPPQQHEQMKPSYNYIKLIAVSVIIVLFFSSSIFFVLNQINNRNNNSTTQQTRQVQDTLVQEAYKTPVSIAPTLPNNPDTLQNPVKKTTSDGNSYILYGEPVGQNNKMVKKIIFSLPGHGTKAESDYQAWQSHLTANGNYALASINWWNGKGEKKEDYYSPPEIIREIEYFLKTNNYDSQDFVILEGFSRGSANTYAVVANDVLLKKKLIDGVISASGKYQSDFAMTEDLLNQNNGNPFSGVYWILACGEKDPKPTRDGCQGMKETELFLKTKGATVIAFLSDPNGSHGSFHQSPLKLAEQALSLFDDISK